MHVAKLPLDKFVIYILACGVNWFNRHYVISTRANSLLPKQALVGLLACKSYIFLALQSTANNATVAVAPCRSLPGGI